MALRRLVPLGSVLLIFEEANLVHNSCTYCSAIDTRMKINFDQVWRPEADYNSSYACTLGSTHEQNIRVLVCFSLFFLLFLLFVVLFFT